MIRQLRFAISTPLDAQTLKEYVNYVSRMAILWHIFHAEWLYLSRPVEYGLC